MDRVVNETGRLIGWALLLLFTNNASGQQDSILLNREIVFSRQSFRLDSLINTLTRQAGIRVSMDTRKLLPSRIIVTGVKKQSVRQLLASIARQSQITYKIVGNHLIFLKIMRTSVSRAKPAIKPNTATNDVVAQSFPYHITGDNRVLNYSSAEVILLQSLSAQNELSIKSVSLPDLAGIRVAAPSQDTIVKKNKEADSTRTFPPALRPYLKLLAATDDLFYISTAIHIGVPAVHLIGSVNTNFSVIGFRYGAGTSIRLDDNARLAISFTTGKLSRTADSLGLKSDVRTRLQRFSFFLEKKMGTKTSLYAGPIFNILRTNYFRDNIPAVPGMDESAADKSLHFLKPLYTFSDNYNALSVKNTKSWIGLQLGIIYMINFSRSQ